MIGRHGLETLSQLIVTDRDKYSDKYGVCTIANDVEIKDHPAFPYRGVMLDTSRNYLSMSSIKSVIRGMGYNKLNRLHLHFTDTASFPLQVDTEPNLFYYGAYSSDMYYDKARIKELTEFAHGYGVSIIPEVDVPSHVNMGWNWGQLEGVGKCLKINISCRIASKTTNACMVDDIYLKVIWPFAQTIGRLLRWNPQLGI